MGKRTEKDAHPMGELNKISKNVTLAVDTFRGKVHVEWDPHGAVTPIGQLVFFIEFLKQGDLFDRWVKESPLDYTSPNAPSKRDVLGTLLLSILSGHNRYAHITAIRGDDVNANLLGMSKVISEDAMRRALLKIDEARGVQWLNNHLRRCYLPLLIEPWILDVDTTVKVLYGKQEGAVVGYNPHKPGRPSHSYHTLMISNLRMILDVEVLPGNETASSYTAPGLFGFLDSIDKSLWPKLLRGDIGFGTDGVMTESEERELPYLFKLKGTKRVQDLILRVPSSDWVYAGRGFEAQESMIQLTTWKQKRRVVIVRKKIAQEILAISTENGEQLELYFEEVKGKVVKYEYAVLVTSMPDPVMAVAQHYRDRADSENAFDETKNQWGWAGFTTHDLKRCRLMAKSIALVYNWWSLFVRLAQPDYRMEAITSRPLLLHAVAKQTKHSGQTHLTITSTHGDRKLLERLLSRVVGFFEELRRCAEQLTAEQRWIRILSKAMEKFLNSRTLKPPDLLPLPA
jgi:hypothetical protein